MDGKRAPASSGCRRASWLRSLRERAATHCCAAKREACSSTRPYGASTPSATGSSPEDAPMPRTSRRARRLSTSMSRRFSTATPSSPFRARQAQHCSRTHCRNALPNRWASSRFARSPSTDTTAGSRASATPASSGTSSSSLRRPPSRSGIASCNSLSTVCVSNAGWKRRTVCGSKPASSTSHTSCASACSRPNWDYRGSCERATRNSSARRPCGASANRRGGLPASCSRTARRAKA